MSLDDDPQQLTRRQFVQTAGAAVLIASTNADASSEPSRSFEHGNPLDEVTYGQVELRPGLHQSQLEQTHSVLMGLDENSLLRPFRARARFDAPGVELGGWYSSDGAVPAHCFGQWLSALSRYYAMTGDEATRAKVHRLVEGFAATVEPEGKFYERYPDARGYSYDLTALGLIDAHRLTHQANALKALAGTTRAVAQYLPGKAVPLFGKLVCDPGRQCKDHTYVIPENQFIAWQHSGDPLHLKMARQYLFDELFDPLSRGENALRGRHAYTYANALCSAAKAYLVLGDDKYLRAAKNGFAFIDSQSYATGGWGPNEVFTPHGPDSDNPKGVKIDDLHDSLAKTDKSFETCGAYAHFKLTRYLLRITKDPRYGDSLERVMYNTVLGAKPLQPDGRAFYYSSYSPAARKEYAHEAKGEWVRWPCCGGSLPQVAADYRIGAYFSDPEGPYVNLYIPSTLRWKQRGNEIALSQTGSYPLGDEVTLTVSASRPSQFTLRLRIPAWAKNASVAVNGKRIAETVEPGTFASLRREWKSGDRIELELPHSLELKPVDAQHPHTAALACGPLVLFAIANEAPKVSSQELLAAKRSNPSSEEWIADTAQGQLRFLPWWAIKEETYFTYLSI